MLRYKSSFIKAGKVGCCAAICAGLLSVPYGAQAESTKKYVEKKTTININENVMVFEGRMSIGMLHGESNEYVYAPEYNHTVSELNWKLKDVWMLGLGGSFSPLWWLNFNADVYFKLNDGDGTMNDYDYLLLDYQYTDYSNHQNVDLTKGIMFDINAEMTFYQYDKSQFFGIVGFKHDTWEWEAHGGTYMYSSYYLYDTVGSFDPNEKVITYEQNYYAPYLGFGFESKLTTAPITFSGRVIGTLWAWGDDEDQHHLRNLVFEDDFDSGTMFGFDLAMRYNFTDNFSMNVAYQYHKYSDMEGDTTITDTTTGQKEKYEGDVAGMDNYAGVVSVGAQVSF